MLLPYLISPYTDIVLPYRAMDRIEVAEPMCRKSKMLIELPISVIPNTEREDPSLANE
jgi:hypothetical protein